MEHGPLQTGIVFVILGITNGGLSEELGWRGYALDHLQQRRSELTASIVVGVLWALWHTGVEFWEAMLSMTAGAALVFAATYLAQYLLWLLPLSLFYSGSGGGLLLTVLPHAPYNITVSIATSAWPDFPMILFLVLLWIWPPAVWPSIAVCFAS
jgi:membrane protease YdiL (CAAX protease family)